MGKCHVPNTGTGNAGQILILTLSTRRRIRLHRRILKRRVISLHGAKTFPAARWIPQPSRRFPFWDAPLENQRQRQNSFCFQQATKGKPRQANLTGFIFAGVGPGLV